jgi:NTE family protein
VVLVTLLAGCAHYGVNQPVNQYDPQAGYRARNLIDPANDDRMLLMLSFSGGGTRAAAFSYGVLETLRDTPVQIGGRQRRLLDEVDWISGVSGGSFTAAYYGLFEDRIFEDFETRFLKKDIQGDLTRATLFNPLNWASSFRPTTIGATSQRTTTTSMSSKERPLVICSPGNSR